MMLGIEDAQMDRPARAEIVRYGVQAQVRRPQRDEGLPLPVQDPVADSGDLGERSVGARLHGIVIESPGRARHPTALCEAVLDDDRLRARGDGKLQTGTIDPDPDEHQEPKTGQDREDADESHPRCSSLGATNRPSSSSASPSAIVFGPITLKSVGCGRPTFPKIVISTSSGARIVGLPFGAMISEIPVAAARTTQRPVSIARICAICACWNGPDVSPNQPSSVATTRNWAPSRTSA